MGLRILGEYRVVMHSCFPDLLSWYSHYLGYHSWHQISWGLGLGCVLGVSLYLTFELIPEKYPTCFMGRVKYFALSNPVSVWLQIRDGWAVWHDGGREDAWLRWRTEWVKGQWPGEGKREKTL